MRTTFIAVLPLVLGLSSSAQTLVRSVAGPAANAHFGKACIAITDQNGDGYKDLLVGAPRFNGERGAIYCVSGAFLATGVGSQVLWSLLGPGAPGNQFGYSLAEIPDITGDGVKEFLIGEPGYDSATANDIGAVRSVNGVSRAFIGLRFGFEQGAAVGTAIAAVGPTAVAVGAPAPLAVTSRVFVCTPHSLGSTGIIVFGDSYGMVQGAELGASLASVPDLNGDGEREALAGFPGAGGVIVLLSGGGSRFYQSQIPGERMGASVDSRSDYNGDGVADIVVGAPNFPGPGGTQTGRVVVLSTANIFAQTPPFEIRTLNSPVSSTSFDVHFGAAVCAVGDLNNDGTGDILVGAPAYTTFGAGGSINNWGLVSIFSGASGARWSNIFGSSTDRLGDSLAGLIGDLDGDGFREFIAASSLADAAGVDSGVVKCYRLFPLAPATYCTGKINSLGCTPAIAFSGSPKASVPTGTFTINATQLVSQKTGLLFYSHAPTGIAFQGGFKCVADPVQRTASQNSGGSASGADCTGAFGFDFNARIQSGVDPSLVVGAELYAQYWSRDPASPSTTSLSNAVRFVINP